MEVTRALRSLDRQYLSPELDTVLTTVPAMVAVLRRLEWVSGVCPTCVALVGNGHHADCAWLAVMKE